MYNSSLMAKSFFLQTNTNSLTNCPSSYQYIFVFSFLDESVYLRTLMRSRLIRFLWRSTFLTCTSTRSPGPRARLRLLLSVGSLSGVINRFGIRPLRPTPMSTKAPNNAAFVTRPVSTIPSYRSPIDTISLLKSACSKSKRRRKTT